MINRIAELLICPPLMCILRVLKPVKVWMSWLAYTNDATSAVTIRRNTSLIYCVWHVQKSWATNTERKIQVLYAVLDTIIWQGLASVAIPGFTINRICYLSNILLRNTMSLLPATRKWTVTAIGLSAIPFIIHPIDRAVDLLMNKTFRQLTTRTSSSTADQQSAKDL